MARQRDPGGSLAASEVLGFARRASETGMDFGVGFCQRFVRTAFGSPGGAPTAVAAFEQALDKHTKGEPKVGSAVFWGGGAGHVAIYAGGGMVYSTDVRRPGKIDLVDMDYITNEWGKPYLGWTSDNNGKRITTWDAKPVNAEGLGGGRKGGKNGDSRGFEFDPDEISEKELRARYGFSARFYDRVPEIKKLVERAVKKGWTPEEFEARFIASDWYRDHTAAEREWALLRTSQPGEAARKVGDARDALTSLATSLGITVEPARLDKIAKLVAVQGFGDKDMRELLAAEFDYRPEGTNGGLAGQTIGDLRKMAAAYLVPLSDATIDRWTTQVLRGDSSAADFEGYMKEQAKSLFPQMVAAIDAGLTPDQYLDPYRELAARELEIAPNAVDWADPKWASLIFATDEKGNRGVRPLADVQRIVRTDARYGWDHTQTAVNAAADLGQRFADLFGRTA